MNFCKIFELSNLGIKEQKFLKELKELLEKNQQLIGGFSSENQMEEVLFESLKIISNSPALQQFNLREKIDLRTQNE